MKGRDLGKEWNLNTALPGQFIALQPEKQSDDLWIGLLLKHFAESNRFVIAWEMLRGKFPWRLIFRMLHRRA